MGKAVAAGTYTDSGWATFHSAKDIKDIINYVKKSSGFGHELKRVIITGFSGGGAVTADATLKLKIDGAVPLCAAAGGGLPTWDVAHEVRLVYDYICDDVPGQSSRTSPTWASRTPSTRTTTPSAWRSRSTRASGSSVSSPTTDTRPNASRSSSRSPASRATPATAGAASTSRARSGSRCSGWATSCTIRSVLKGKRIGFNEELDYTSLGDDPMLAGQYNAGVERVTAGKGRKLLRKAIWPDFTKGVGKKVAYPILSMAGANDWLVIPEFNRIYTDALTAGNRPTRRPGSIPMVTASSVSRKSLRSSRNTSSGSARWAVHTVCNRRRPTSRARVSRCREASTAIRAISTARSRQARSTTAFRSVKIGRWLHKHRKRFGVQDASRRPPAAEAGGLFFGVGANGWPGRDA